MLISIEASHAVKEKRTGVEEACWQMIENLKSVLPPDNRVILYSHKMPVDELKDLPENWEWKILRWPLKKLWSQFALAFALFRDKPDVFFATGQLIPFFIPSKIKVVTFVHDSAFEAIPESYTFLGGRYLKIMNRRIVRRSDIIITSTDFNKNELIKYYRISPDKIVVVPLAYDKNIYNLNNFIAGGLKEKYQLTKPYFIYVGRLEDKKNTPLLIKAFEEVRKNQDCQLLLVGKPGFGYGKVQSAIESSPYKSDIINPGWVESDHLPGLISSASALVFPSRYEGFGLPVLEAMACGCPVIASDLQSLREAGGEAAEYVPANYNSFSIAMKKALDNEVWANNHHILGLLRVDKFAWDKTAVSLGEIIAK